jgi:hypothetical protein
VDMGWPKILASPGFPDPIISQLTADGRGYDTMLTSARLCRLGASHMCLSAAKSGRRNEFGVQGGDRPRTRRLTVSSTNTATSAKISGVLTPGGSAASGNCMVKRASRVVRVGSNLNSGRAFRHRDLVHVGAPPG